jgi:predicted Zn finger-like uncharacterized protein
MLIVCPNCASSYEVAPDKLGEAGRSVRCVRCRAVWFATAPSEEPTPAATNLFAADEPETALAGAEQIEGGEFGWTFAPEGGAGEKNAWSDPTEPDPAEPDLAEVDQDPAFDDEAIEGDPSAPPADPAPVMVSDAPSIAPVLEQETPPAEDQGAGEDVETLAALRAKQAARRKRRRGRPGLSLAIFALAAAIVGLIGLRKEVVQLAPQTASLYRAIGLAVNLRGLAFEGVKTTREVSEGVTVLVVEGAVVNVTSHTVEVPRLRFGVRNEAGLEIYAWTSVPARTILGPGEAVEFRSRLASPPAEARDVVVRFFNRRDVVAGLR